jgi:hypothetical protein
MRFPAELMLALRITIFAALVPWLFRRPLRQLEAWTEPANPPRLPRTQDADRIIRLTGMICRTARPLISHPCQVRGLTQYYFLRRVGVDVSLVFGVAAGGGVGAGGGPGAAPGAAGATGHCWLMKDGEPYLESVDPREHFIPMYAFNAHKKSTPSPTIAEGRPYDHL